MSFDDRSEARFGVYVEALTGVIGHADRATPLRHSCTGLLMPAARKSVEPAARKSVEPMAAMTAPARVAAQHQSLLHFVGQAPWSDTAVLTKVRDLVLPAIERAGPMIDQPEQGAARAPLQPDRGWTWREESAMAPAGGDYEIRIKEVRSFQ